MLLQSFYVSLMTSMWKIDLDISAFRSTLKLIAIRFRTGVVVWLITPCRGKSRDLIPHDRK